MQFQKKRCVAMLLAGGQGSRLMVLTENTAKPAVPFGGKYRIIDFPLSNCVNSKIDTVGILTQYQPLEMLGAQKAVAERQPGRDAKVLHQRQYLLRARSAGTDAPAAPDAAFRCAVDGSNLAPIVKISPVRPVKRQKCAVELVKFK